MSSPPSPPSEDMPEATTPKRTRSRNEDEDSKEPLRKKQKTKKTLEKQISSINTTSSNEVSTEEEEMEEEQEEQDYVEQTFKFTVYMGKNDREQGYVHQIKSLMRSTHEKSSYTSISKVRAQRVTDIVVVIYNAQQLIADASEDEFLQGLKVQYTLGDALFDEPIELKSDEVPEKVLKKYQKNRELINLAKACKRDKESEVFRKLLEENKKIIAKYPLVTSLPGKTADAWCSITDKNAVMYDLQYHCDSWYCQVDVAENTDASGPFITLSQVKDIDPFVHAEKVPIIAHINKKIAEVATARAKIYCSGEDLVGSITRSLRRFDDYECRTEQDTATNLLGWILDFAVALGVKYSMNHATKLPKVPKLSKLQDCRILHDGEAEDSDGQTLFLMECKPKEAFDVPDFAVCLASARMKLSSLISTYDKKGDEQRSKWLYIPFLIFGRNRFTLFRLQCNISKGENKYFLKLVKTTKDKYEGICLVLNCLYQCVVDRKQLKDSPTMTARKSSTVDSAEKRISMGDADYIEKAIQGSDKVLLVTHKLTKKKFIAKRMEKYELFLLPALKDCDQIIKYVGRVYEFLLYPVYETLSRYVHDKGFVWKFAMDVMKGLECCHSYDIIHKDIKCDNVVFDVSTKTFMLIDFGQSEQSKEFRCIGGAPGCQAPEMFQEGAKTNKVDIWAAGIAISDLLLNYETFQYYKFSTTRDNDASKEQEALSIRTKVLREFGNERNANDQFKQGMLPIIEKMLEKDATLRPTADAVLAELQKLKPENQDSWQPVETGKERNFEKEQKNNVRD